MSSFARSVDGFIRKGFLRGTSANIQSRINPDVNWKEIHLGPGADRSDRLPTSFLLMAKSIRRRGCTELDAGSTFAASDCGVRGNPSVFGGANDCLRRTPSGETCNFPMGILGAVNSSESRKGPHAGGPEGGAEA